MIIFDIMLRMVSILMRGGILLFNFGSLLRKEWGKLGSITLPKFETLVKLNEAFIMVKG
jgi:hypothetical protein